MVRQGIFILALVFFAQGLFIAQTQDALLPVKVGDPAPAISLEALIQAPIKAENIENDLKGKVVVLEFWATWCGPCREAIPHMNELEKEFRTKPVRFLSVTDEEEWKVKNFLKVNPMRGWIGLDTDGSLFKAYGFKTIPQAVVIDLDGRIAALTLPRSLNSEMIKQLLERKPIDLEPGDAISARTQEAQPKDPQAQTASGQDLLELSIRPASPSNSMSFSRRSFKAKGMTLHKLVSLAYDVSHVRLVASTPLADRTYAVAVNLPKNDRAALKSLLRQALDVTFGLNVFKEMRETEVFILKTSEKTKKALRPSKHDSEMPLLSDDGQISSQGTSIDTFCVVLEKTIGKVVQNETGLEGFYEIALYWNPDDPASVVTAIKDQLGLELSVEIRTIEVTVFEIKE
jgi:uncharacterized protein (TIGR03435 family)